MSASLQISREGRVQRLALNRPDKRNALNADLCQSLVRAFDDAENDPAIGAVLLTGNGKSFCAGMDLEEARAAGSDNFAPLHELLFTVGTRLSKPVVGEVRGAALAGGAGLVANCHVVVASEDATFGLTEIRRGLWPFLILRSVVLAVGERRTTELALTGRIFGAREAEGYGLVHHVVRAEDLEARAGEIAAGLAGSSATAMRSGLSCLRQIRGKSWQQAGEICRAMRQELFLTPDFQEGARAFQEKRPPEWPSLKR
jgi:enoyl-CoA hydratase/carnithine racemase